MSEENENENKKKIRIEVDRSPEIERIKLERDAFERELIEKRAILEAQALAELEKSRTEIMDMAKIGKLSDDQLAEIEQKLEDPKQVESIKMMVKMISDSVEKVKTELPKKKIPDGKTSIIPPNKSGQQFETESEVITSLYFTAYDPKAGATAEQKRDAIDKINQLWTTMLKNPVSRQPRKIIDVSACPQCGHVNESPRGSIVITCEKCKNQYK